MFYATDNAEQEEAVTLQHGDFKDCVVPTWRVSDKEPTDPRKALPFLQTPSGSSAVNPCRQKGPAEAGAIRSGID